MEQRINTLIWCGAITILLYIIVLALIFVDLYVGVGKAKQRGEMRTSEAYKRTVDKINKYFTMLIALTLVDIMFNAVAFYMCHEYHIDMIMLPYFTLIGAAYIGFVEVKSITEPANVKERKQREDFKRLLLDLSKDKTLLEKVLALAANERKEEKNETKQ
jgi:hypothetical protein